ncbi:MAG: Rho termination factor N-terminal domain-containing protein, partial [Bacteroidales bacterium]
MYDILELSKKLLPELKDIAKELKIKKAESLKKQDLIYKILDQQAIEATDINIQLKAETEEIPSSTEVNSTESDAALRRGKRPRTLKPVIKRSVESVMSVSPDGVKRPEPRQGDWQEQVKKPEKTDEKSDLFKKPEQLHDNRKAPKWRTDQKYEEN